MFCYYEFGEERITANTIINNLFFELEYNKK